MKCGCSSSRSLAAKGAPAAAVWGHFGVSGHSLRHLLAEDEINEPEMPHRREDENENLQITRTSLVFQ